MEMKLNPVVFLTPYAEKQDLAKEKLHQAFDVFTQHNPSRPIDMLAYRSDGKVVVGWNRPDNEDRNYIYDTLSEDFTSSPALFDLTFRHGQMGKPPEYSPEVHLNTLHRLNQRADSGQSVGRFLAYAFITHKSNEGEA